MRKNKKIVLTAILLAMLDLLSRFLSIKTPISKISFAFVPTMLCAIWLGPKWTIICITNLADEILIADRTLILDNGKIALERQVNKVKNVIIFLIFIFYATLLFFMHNNIELIVFRIINLILMIIIKINLKKAIINLMKYMPFILITFVFNLILVIYRLDLNVQQYKIFFKFIDFKLRRWYNNIN